MTELNVKIADELFTLRISLPRAAARFKEFQTEQTGGTVLQPTEAQTERIRSLLHEKVVREGCAPEEAKINPAQAEFLALHELIARTLVSRGILLVHGAAVVAEGSAVLFIAPSGTGKSTHTALWTKTFGERVFIINDDKQLLRIGSDGVITTYATPWGCIHPVPAVRQAPLQVMVWLERGENSICPVTQKQFFPHLFKASLEGRTPAETVAILELQTALLRSVRLYHMTCTPTPEAAQMAYRAIAEAQK